MMMMMGRERRQQRRVKRTGVGTEEVGEGSQGKEGENEASINGDGETCESRSFPHARNRGT